MVEGASILKYIYCPGAICAHILKAKIVHAHSFLGYKQGIYDQLALRELDCVRMLAKAAAAHATVFPVSINLIGQFGTFEARPS